MCNNDFGVKNSLDLSLHVSGLYTVRSSNSSTETNMKPDFKTKMQASVYVLVLENKLYHTESNIFFKILKELSGKKWPMGKKCLVSCMITFLFQET